MLIEGKSLNNGKEHRQVEEQIKVQNTIKNYFTKVHDQV